MPEYIEREALIAELCKDQCRCTPPPDGPCANCYEVRKVAEFPAVEVAPVKYGRWIQKDSRNPFSWRNCSECGHIVTAAQARVYKGCPKCLARMDGDGK